LLEYFLNRLKTTFIISVNDSVSPVIQHRVMSPNKQGEPEGVVAAGRREVKGARDMIGGADEFTDELCVPDVLGWLNTGGKASLESGGRENDEEVDGAGMGGGGSEGLGVAALARWARRYEKAAWSTAGSLANSAAYKENAQPSLKIFFFIYQGNIFWTKFQCQNQTQCQCIRRLKKKPTGAAAAVLVQTKRYH
jgi:hypothetical protein